jgi:type I restriction enzyme S subunit
VSYRVDPFKLNNYFLLYALQSNYLQTQIHSLASGSTVHMRVPDSKQLKLPLPNLKEQECIVERLNLIKEQTQSLESIYGTKLSSLNELKQSLLQKAFSGELTAEADTLMEEAVA